MIKKSFIFITLFIVLSQCSLQSQILEILNEIPESIPRIVQANVETLKNSMRSILFPQLANRPPVSPRAFHREPIKQLTRKQRQQLQKQEAFDFMSLFLNKIEQIHHVALNHNKTKSQFELTQEQIKKNQTATTIIKKTKQRQLETGETNEEKLQCFNGAYLVQAEKLIFSCNKIEISTDNYEYLKVCNDSTWTRSYYYKNIYLPPDLPTEDNYTKCIENYKTLCFPLGHEFTEEITNVSQLAIKFEYSIPLTNACYCPKDTFGINCQYINQIFCDWTDQSTYQTCPTYNEFYYVSAYDGEPPCYRFQVKCQNEDPEKLHEGITVNFAFLSVDQSAFQEPQDFVYYIDNKDTNLTSTYNFEIVPQMSLINWNQFSDKKSFSFNDIGKDCIIGNKVSTWDIKFDNISSKYNIGGRYYLEGSYTITIYQNILDLGADLHNENRSIDFQYNANNQPFHKYFENAEYVEPTKETNVNVLKIIIIILIMSILQYLIQFIQQFTFRWVVRPLFILPQQEKNRKQINS